MKCRRLCKWLVIFAHRCIFKGVPIFSYLRHLKHDSSLFKQLFSTLKIHTIVRIISQKLIDVVFKSCHTLLVSDVQRAGMCAEFLQGSGSLGVGALQHPSHGDQAFSGGPGSDGPAQPAVTSCYGHDSGAWHGVLSMSAKSVLKWSEFQGEVLRPYQPKGLTTSVGFHIYKGEHLWRI